MFCFVPQNTATWPIGDVRKGVKFSGGFTAYMNEEAWYFSRYMKASFPVPGACCCPNELASFPFLDASSFQTELAASGTAALPLFCFVPQNTATWPLGDVRKGVKFSRGFTAYMNEEAWYLSRYMKASFPVLDACSCGDELACFPVLDASSCQTELAAAGTAV